MEALLKRLFYDPDTGYQSVSKLHKKAREEDPTIRYTDVKAWLDKQYSAQVVQQPRRPAVFSTILANKPRDGYQMDIMVYDRYTLNSYKYILCVIDVHSRYAQCRALTNKEAPYVLERIKDIFDVMGVPKNVNADQEFNNAVLNPYFEEQGIKMWFSDPNELNKQAIVERFHRTLALMLQKWRASGRDRRWYAVLDSIVKNYNSTYHRTIKAKPVDVWMGTAQNTQTIRHVERSFDIGDQVRLETHRKVLEKGDILRYSPDVYTITAIQGTKHTLRNNRTGEDAKRPYKPYEIRKVGDIQMKDPEETPQTTIPEEQRAARTERRVAREQRQLADNLPVAPEGSKRQRRPSARITGGAAVKWPAPLLASSDPLEVVRRARALLGPRAVITPSSRKDKKYALSLDGGKPVHFGHLPMHDFTKHRDEARRQRFLTRNRRWADAPVGSAAWAAFYLLW